MRPRLLSSIAALAVVPTLIVACGSDGSDAVDEVGGTVALGRTTVIADGFEFPTQITGGPGDSILVAQLAGSEDEQAGEVVVFDPTTGSREVILRNLDKPTGVAWLDDELWVMVRRGLVKATWDGDGPAGPVEVMLDNLPFNGRSEGTLTAIGDGRILYETSGSIADGEVVQGSGLLWAFDPVSKTSADVAIGVKNAYAHAMLPDGRVITTDIGDNVDPQPVEEVNVIGMPGPTNLGWPDCAGDETCPGVASPLATFDPRSTPTGVAVFGDDAYVALFVTGQIVRVPLTGGATTIVVDGLEGPHSLLVYDGRLLVSEHLTGRVLELSSIG